MNALSKPFQPFTSAEIHKMARRGAFDDIRVELRRGMLVKMRPKHVRHIQVQADLAFALGLAIRAAGLSWRVGNDGTVSYGQGFDPAPEIVVFDPVLLTDAEGPLSPVSVKLIVEVADTSLNDDLGEKREDYARFGLVEYWLADVNAKVVHMHAEPKNGALARMTTVNLTDPLAMLTQPNIVAQIA